MLINCPECELQISDKAILCPHCGYPMKPTKISSPTVSNRKHKRLPNGFGQISELKTRNLRKPFRAMVTVGKDAHGKPICKLLKPNAYFNTYNEAYQALMEYNRKPYDLTTTNVTMNELYTKFTRGYFSKISQSTINVTELTWKYCHMIHETKISDVRIRHLRTCIEQADYTVNGMTHKASSTIKTHIKSLLNQLFDYAIEYEYVDRNYARDLKISIDEADSKHHIPFTDKELELLWSIQDTNITARLILIQCYSGWRPQELLNLDKENINLDDLTFTGGMKTKAGTNRTIPIHSRIKDLLKEYPFTIQGKRVTYDVYRYQMNKLIKEYNLNPEHKPHDGRMTFITNAKRAGVDEYAIKRIVGHVITDITEDIYTVRPMSWLRDEMEKIK